MQQFAGEALDGLLSVLVELGGDRLLLQTDTEPVARQGDRKLRLTLPETSNATLLTLCGRMAQAHDAGRTSVFTYQSKSHGAFGVEIEGDFAPGAQVRLQLRRLVGKPAADRTTTSDKPFVMTPPSGALPSGALPSGALPSGALPSGATPSAATAATAATSVAADTAARPPEFEANALGVPARGASVDDRVPFDDLPSADRGTSPDSDEALPGRASREQSRAALLSRVALTSNVAAWSTDAELATLFRQALDVGATDLHLTDGQSPRLRCGGELLRAGGAFDGMARLLSPAQLRAVEAGHALDLATTFESRARVRINVFRSELGLCAAVRFLPLRAPSLESLGLPAELVSLGDLRSGLVLICGTTGSGKSTTLAALLQERIRKRARHVITLENPIEYLLDGGERSLVRQREVPRHVPTFAAGLRDALREDPDEIVIGEMRDAETIGLASTAAETGHLVWSSLHSRTARSAIERIVDQVGPEVARQLRAQLADSLRAVVSQRLVYGENEAGRAAAGARPRAVVAAEVMTVTPAVAHLIREGKTEQLAIAVHSGKDAGMLPLERDLARLVKQGKISRAVARAHADDPALFDRYA